MKTKVLLVGAKGGWLISFFLSLAMCEIPCIAGELNGKVVGVHDGDSLTLLVEKDAVKSTLKIRLNGIDAPELGQPFGKAGKQALSDLVYGQTVRIEEHGKDRYKRWLGDVYNAEGIWINQTMVSQGFAWVYRKYSSNESLLQAEATALNSRAGLWADTSPVAPWLWRSTKNLKSVKP